MTRPASFLIPHSSFPNPYSRRRPEPRRARIIGYLILALLLAWIIWTILYHLPSVRSAL